MKAVVAAFNKEKALVGAFSVIVKTDCETDGALHSTSYNSTHIVEFLLQNAELPLQPGVAAGHLGAGLQVRGEAVLLEALDTLDTLDTSPGDGDHGLHPGDAGQTLPRRAAARTHHRAVEYLKQTSLQLGANTTNKQLLKGHFTCHLIS